jgi:Family of unknown function (DUF5989)
MLTRALPQLLFTRLWSQRGFPSIGGHSLMADGSDFEKLGHERRHGLVGEFFGYLKQSKKWWLLPILLAMLVLGALVFLGGTGAAPFIYTLF